MENATQQSNTSTTNSQPLPSAVKFEVLSSKENARRGRLIVNQKTVDTPNLILYTKQGSPLNLTPDLLQDIKEAKILQLCFQDM